MSHFAEIDENGTVLRVIVAEQDFIDAGVVVDPARWVKTSYSGSTRKRYASIGGTYDKTRDAFIRPKPFASWRLNDQTIEWDPPVERPAGEASWGEVGQRWIMASSKSPRALTSS
jgi:hypothetical protein